MYIFQGIKPVFPTETENNHEELVRKASKNRDSYNYFPEV
jgi:hypothetical protein